METRLEVAEDNVREEESLKNKIWSETKKMWIVAGPAILIRFSTFGINVITQGFIGHVGATELASYALVFTVLFRFVLGIQFGMISGFNTLCGQAYGAKQYHKLGIYLQQSWILLFTVSTILSLLFIFASPILKALRQDEDIAEMSGTVALWFIPVIFSYAVLYCCNMFLQSQSKNLIPSCLAVVSLLLHIFLSWLLTVKYKFGVPGAMVSTIFAYSVANVGQLIYVVFGGCRETWKGFTTLAFKDLGPAIKLSISSGVMLCLDFWYNTVLILLTGNMGDAKVTIDALSICLNISGWALMISIGFMATTGVRVSNELGRGDTKAVKFSIVIILLTSFTIALVLSVFLLFYREHLGYMFTKSRDVAEAVARLSPLLAFSVLVNGVQPVFAGVAIGAGRQGIVAYVNIGSYYLIGIPLGVVLGYVFKLHVEGVWMGMIFGTAIQIAILVIMTFRTDWDDQVSLAQKRINKRSVDAETSNNSSNIDSGAT